MTAPERILGIVRTIEVRLLGRTRQKAPWSVNMQQELRCLPAHQHLHTAPPDLNHSPEPRGVNVAAIAALGEIPIFFAGCTFTDFGVKAGDSTFKDFLSLMKSVWNLQTHARGTHALNPFEAIDPKSWL
jgi:hypothetical protein